jgi:hypothetical protein
MGTTRGVHRTGVESPRRKRGGWGAPAVGTGRVGSTNSSNKAGGEHPRRERCEHSRRDRSVWGTPAAGMGRVEGFRVGRARELGGEHPWRK